MDKVILAKDVVLDSGLGSSRPNDNQMIFGGSGSGKSMSIFLPTLYNIRNSSFIGTFAKRGVVSRGVAYFKEQGYKNYVCNLANPEKGELLPDPLDYVTSDDDVQELARQIANGNPEYLRCTKFDPFWREASESLLIGLIYYVLTTEDHPCMKKVIDLFYSLKIKEDGRAIITTLDGKIEYLESKAPDSIAARKLGSFRQLPYATATCVRDDLEKAIQNMFPVSIQEAMSDKAYIDFEKFATEKSAMFIITSPVRTSQYGFANLLFSIAIRQLMEFAERREDNRLPRHVKLLFDDFSCGFPILNYEKTISTFRAAGISSMMLCQSLSQLDATYGPDNSTVILDNCSTLVYLPGGMKTCSYVSEMINLPLDEIMFMEMGNVVVFQSGKQPVIASRYDTPSDPLYKKFISSGTKKKKEREKSNAVSR